MSESRLPDAFPVEGKKKARNDSQQRPPVAFSSAEEPRLVMAEIDAFQQEDEAEKPAMPTRSSRLVPFRLGLIFLSSLSLLFALAIGLWIETLVHEMFTRSDWLGWGTSILAGIAAMAMIGMLIRELYALIRLRSVAVLRTRASNALEHGNARISRAVVNDLLAFTSANPATAAGRKTLAGLDSEVIDAGDLIRIAERELFQHLDIEAKRIVMSSAKRVSVVTAVSPRALVDVAFVLFEASRLIRKLSQHYGSRPGTLGFLKLARDVIAHLAVTGSIAVGDSLVQQVIGHGLAARLSSRLGEGIVNGLMTVRIGIAAMDVVRPLPFNALKRPSMSDFLTGLTGNIDRKK